MSFTFAAPLTTSFLGSGILEAARTIKAKAKIPIARYNAGLASRILAFCTTSPIKYPTRTGTIVAPIELIDPPNWINWLPLFPPPPSVLSIGFTTAFNIHIEKPETSAPIR